VILVDANILIYATDPRSERHDQARTWLDSQLNGEGRVAVGKFTRVHAHRDQSDSFRAPPIGTRGVASCGRVA